MANKTLLECSAPSVRNIHTGPTLQMDKLEFELKPSLINLVQATTFGGKEEEDATNICRIFWRLEAPSSSRMLPKISYSLVSFHSH
jgi:hypothetical protein